MSHSREDPLPPPPADYERAVADALGPQDPPVGEPPVPWPGPGWPGDDSPTAPHVAAEEPSVDARLTLRVTPAVHILVNADYQLAIWVKGGQAVINPAVLFDSVNTAARWVSDHEPHPPRAAKEE